MALMCVFTEGGGGVADYFVPYTELNLPRRISRSEYTWAKNRALWLLVAQSIHAFGASFEVFCRLTVYTVCMYVVILFNQDVLCSFRDA